jgi:hypothetical protein
MGSWILRERWGINGSFWAKQYWGMRLGLRFAGPVLFLEHVESSQTTERPVAREQYFCDKGRTGGSGFRWA